MVGVGVSEGVSGGVGGDAGRCCCGHEWGCGCEDECSGVGVSVGICVCVRAFVRALQSREEVTDIVYE